MALASTQENKEKNKNYDFILKNLAAGGKYKNF